MDYYKGCMMHCQKEYKEALRFRYAPVSSCRLGLATSNLLGASVSFFVITTKSPFISYAKFTVPSHLMSLYLLRLGRSPFPFTYSFPPAPLRATARFSSPGEGAAGLRCSLASMFPPPSTPITPGCGMSHWRTGTNFGLFF